MLLLTCYLQQWADGAVFGQFLLVVRFLFGRFGVLYLKLVDCAFCVWLTFLMLLICLGYVAPMGVSLACTMCCFYGLNYATACACDYDTSMLASMIYLWATVRG
jgi:hypothetical protein